MGCLYCGKDIGPFRQLRDSEFCSVSHRDRYHDRLGRALGRLGAAERAPASIAGFRIRFPLQEGSCRHVPVIAELNSIGSVPRSAGPLPVTRTVPLSSPHQDLLPQPVLPGAAPQPGALSSIPVPLRFPRVVSPSGAALLSAIRQCDVVMPIEEPEVVECFVRPSVSGIIEPAASTPGMAAVRLAGLMMPAATVPLRALGPEPALVDVFPILDSRPAVRSTVPAILRFSLYVVEEIVARPKPALLRSSQPAPAWDGPAAIPVESMPAIPAFVPAALASAVALRLPEGSSRSLTAAPLRLIPLTASSVPGPRPVAVESMPTVPAAVPVPLAPPLAVRCPALAHFQPAEEAGEALAAPAMAPGPNAVETLPAAVPVAALPVAPRLMLIRRPLEASAPVPSAAGLDRADFRLMQAPAVAPFLPAKPPVFPMLRMSAQPAGSQPERPKPAIPHPGVFALEYYCQRSAVSTPSDQLAWMQTPVAVKNPPFQIRAALKSLHAYGSKSRKLPPIEEIFAGQTKDGEPLRLRFTAAVKIAATIMVGLALWSGSQLAHFSQFRALVAASERNVTAQAEVRRVSDGNGPMSTFRRAIADRAAAEVTDTFASGMEAWGAANKTWAPGWQHSPDGYVRTGDIALFRPSLHYTDYHMEFYGQIEQKSMGWVVRAKDKKNYYAMKFTVIEPGLRPIIAIQHYQVSNGKRGQMTQTPLSVMVHNNQPYHVAVEVRGNRFAAALEGEPVDSWTEDTLAQGGIGFFSDPGERARLYWMKVSRNQDWLGRFCAYLSGDSRAGNRQTADLRLRGVPQFWAISLAPIGHTQ